MLGYFFNTDSTIPLDSQIDAVLDEMQNVGVSSPEYPKMMSYLERLSDIKAKARQDPISRDTVAIVLGNLIGILLIVAYEQKHVMTSKGLGQIIRPK